MFDCLAMSYKVSDCDHSRVLTQTYNGGPETHLVAGVMGVFVFPLAAIAQALTLTFVGSTALKRGP